MSNKQNATNCHFYINFINVSRLVFRIIDNATSTICFILLNPQRKSNCIHVSLPLGIMFET